MRKNPTKNKLMSMAAVCILLSTAGFFCLQIEDAEALTHGDWVVTDYEGDTWKVTGYNGNQSVIEMPDRIQNKDIKCIGRGLFANNTTVTSITLPYWCEVIENNAFQGCTALTEVEMPRDLTSIGNQAFDDCTSLNSIDLKYPLSEIGTGAFANCTSLTFVGLPDYLEVVSDSLFNGCTALTELIIPSTVKTIGSRAFMNCTSLEGLTIPDKVTRIEERTFSGCSSMYQIWLPSSLTFVHQTAFNGCNDLVEVVVDNNFNQSILSGVLPSQTEIYVYVLKHTIKFNSDGGNTISNMKVTIGDPYGTLPVPVKTGYTFDGWYDNATKVTSSTVPDGNKTLKAHWLANNIHYSPPLSANNPVAGIFWTHQISSTPGVSITISGNDVSWLTANNGKISGTPPAAGSYEVFLLLTAPGYVDTSQPINLTVVPQLVLTNSPASGAIAYALS